MPEETLFLMSSMIIGMIFSAGRQRAWRRLLASALPPPALREPAARVG